MSKRRGLVRDPYEEEGSGDNNASETVHHETKDIQQSYQTMNTQPSRTINASKGSAKKKPNLLITSSAKSFPPYKKHSVDGTGTPKIEDKPFVIQPDTLNSSPASTIAPKGSAKKKANLLITSSGQYFPPYGKLAEVAPVNIVEPIVEQKKTEGDEPETPDDVPLSEVLSKSVAINKETNNDSEKRVEERKALRKAAMGGRYAGFMEKVYLLSYSNFVIMFSGFNCCKVNPIHTKKTYSRCRHRNNFVTRVVELSFFYTVYT